MRNILICGNSHARGFENFTYDEWRVDCMATSGASIKGLPRRESTLGLKKKIYSKLKDKKYEIIILNYGQVDIDLGYYYNKYEKSSFIDYKSYVAHLIIAYRSFIEELRTETNIELILHGINLPTLFGEKNFMKYTSDIISNGKLCNFEEEEKGIKERTEKTIYFNSELMKLARQLNIKYIDNMDISLDSETGILKTKYHPGKDNDHHVNMDVKETREDLYYTSLKKILKI